MPFQLLVPLTWTHTVKAKFNDAASYGNGKREGILYVPQGMPADLTVRAATTGVVERVAFYAQGYGNYVVLRHDFEGQRYMTWYAHMADRPNLQPGQTVAAGAPIGRAGSSGSADEVCLFFTVQHIGKGLKGYVVTDVIDPGPLFAQVVTGTDNAAYVADVTVPDGTPVRPGDSLKKIWQVRNTGTTAWGDGYTLAFYSGHPMGSGASVALPAAQPGDSVGVAITLSVPNEPGLLRTTWQARNAADQPFGETLYAEINVQAVTQPSLSVARFVRDVTVPDGERKQPGEAFTKTWRIKNDGTTTWGAGYELRFARDERMGGPVSVALPAIRPGQEADVSIPLIAPQGEGRYRSTWQPYSPEGRPFDFEMYAEINVSTTKTNMQRRFSSPTGGNYSIGWRFRVPVNYGKGWHRGVDYVSRVGDGLPIYAAAHGTVVYSKLCDPRLGAQPNFFALGLSGIEQSRIFTHGADSQGRNWNYGFGHLIIVRYAWDDLPVDGRAAMSANNFTDWYAYAFYAHLREIFIGDGAAVEPGLQIGSMGNTGNSTGTHLHLEIRCQPTLRTGFIGGDNLIDPLSMFSE